MINEHPRTHQLKLGRAAVRLITQGRQTVEGRLASGRMGQIQPGSIICFNAGEICCRVTRVTRYANFRDMVTAETPAALGEKPDDIAAAIKSYQKIFWYTDVLQREALAFALEVCNLSPCGKERVTQACLWAE